MGPCVNGAGSAWAVNVFQNRDYPSASAGGCSHRTLSRPFLSSTGPQDLPGPYPGKA
ncbi:hypothetical protein [Chryseobacterium gregarium]|uniref:hypothetical protein n=1 Tax=Chryseobacterium gregarium TaxID=456299 RepID=UPI0003FC1B02|nr:hypothetical protein [Chryseobacterium gregarium]